MKNLIYMLLFLLLQQLCFAQIQKLQETNSTFFSIIDAKTSYLSLKIPENVERTISELKPMFGNSNLNTFHLFKENKDANGNLHKKYQRYYNGILVEGAIFILHCDENGMVQYVNGDFDNPIDQNLTVRLSSMKAIEVAKSMLPKNIVYKWQDTLRTNRAEDNEVLSIDSSTSKAELVYHKHPMNGLFVPSYRVYISAVEATNDEILIIDAMSGELLERNSTIKSCFPNHENTKSHLSSNIIKQKKPSFYPPFFNRNKRQGLNYLGGDSKFLSCNGDCFSGIGHTIIYGAQYINMGKHQFFNVCKYRLLENCYNVILNTLTKTPTSTPYCYCGGLGGANYEFTDQTTLFNFAVLKTGVQTHWCLEKSLEYFRSSLFNRSSFDGAGHAVTAICNQTNSNAEFNLSSLEILIGTQGGALSTDPNSIDLIGHEFTHGISKFEIGGTTLGVSFDPNGEPGALDESFSDIFGAMIAYYTKSNYSTGTNFSYDLFLDIMNHPVTNFGTCNNINYQSHVNRNMASPNSCLQPDTYGGTYWIPTTCTTIDNGGIHHNNQIQNHWFYLLAEGGSGTNDNNNVYCVSGIGKDKAARIAYDNLCNQLLHNATFASARAGSIASAISLFGANSNEVAQVTAAWYAVGVGANYTGQIDIKNYVATGTENYTQWNSKVEMSNYDANSGSNVTTTSNKEVSIQPNTSIISGANFNAFIQPACLGAARMANGDPIKDPNASENITKERNQNINEASKYYSDIVPNPSTGIFKLLYNENNEFPNRITISNLFGKIIFDKEINTKADFTIDLSTVAIGIYNAKIKYNDHTEFKKLIKN